MITDKIKIMMKSQLLAIYLLTKVDNLGTIILTTGGLFAFLQSYFDNLYLPVLAVLLVVVALDTFTGFLKAWKNRVVDSGAMLGLGIKVILYAVLWLLGHSLTIITDVPILTEVMSFFGYSLHMFLIVRESWSILENIEEIKPGSTPMWLRQRMKNYIKTGKHDDVVQEQQETHNETVNPHETVFAQKTEPK